MERAKNTPKVFWTTSNSRASMNLSSSRNCEVFLVTCSLKVQVLYVANIEAVLEIGEARCLSSGRGRVGRVSVVRRDVAGGVVSRHIPTAGPFDSVFRSQSLVNHITAERSAAAGIRS
jgi:hypothetical protein